ncbi:hypothetical protein [Pontibacter oryzae]|uniref:Uncharacterized protein n=1 Tax=Pontibacter oryzae TaxID=2304593 RepID=A0A399SJJ9_9BACT|nr:hypothetical protein [Pontibacter oryzae]RIJ42663.1 hypothetical protein D1627_02065 [Pontibacter oryzae]
MWYYLDCSGLGISKSFSISFDAYCTYKQKHQELSSDIETFSGKLEFFKNNKQLFIFPFNHFTVRLDNEPHYKFDFKPSEYLAEIYIYNHWFVEMSMDCLTNAAHQYTDILFKSCAQLWNNFLKKEDDLPPLKKFVKYEKMKFRELCELYAPGRFDFYYKFDINKDDFWGPKHEISKDYWTEIFVKETVDYIIKLERYNQKKIHEQLALANSSINFSEAPSLPAKPAARTAVDSKTKEVTFLQLFRSNQENVDRFITMLVKYEYLTHDLKWNFDFYRPGLLVPIIDYLEKESIIRNLSNRSKLGEIFNKQFGQIMSIRNYSKPKMTLGLDSNLRRDLESLK